MSEVVKELRRELAMRRTCYPNWVAAGRLTKATADHRIAMMEQAIVALEVNQPKQQSMFGAMEVP
jgi:5-enolpyruvylshikimate-3-phosphate synthase